MLSYRNLDANPNPLPIIIKSILNVTIFGYLVHCKIMLGPGKVHVFAVNITLNLVEV